MTAPISPEDLARIRDALAAGRKIEAIKIYREATGLGLAEAKDAVDRMEAEAGGLPTNAPVKTGCAGLIVACALPIVWLIAR